MARPDTTATGVVGIFAHIDLLIETTRAAAQGPYTVVDVFSPVPVPEVADLVVGKPSPVRFWTFVFCALGLVGGFALGIGSAMVWDIIVGGKPATNHVPFVVMAFEALILLGALGTFTALLVHAKLPFRQFPGVAYHEDFSKDSFGLWLSCEPYQCHRAEAFLKDSGAVDVSPVGEIWTGRKI